MRVWGDDRKTARELAAAKGIEHYVADEQYPFQRDDRKEFHRRV